ncbi:hypothetical protein EXIGLDRAFT_607874, partial [Exidia glandulosa HHB12029]
MIALCRAKAWIVHLKQDDASEEEGLPGTHRPWAQRGMRGHIITYPQHPEHIATLLPPSLDEIAARIAVIFVGSSPPTAEWLRSKAKPLSVRADKVRAALLWLKDHNPLYRDVELNYQVLDQLHLDATIPFDVQHISPNRAEESLTSRYDAQPTPSLDPADAGADCIAFQNVVIADVEGRASSNDLRAAALRHLKSGGGAVHIYHDARPADAFKNPNLFPMIYPTLFPYGIGGFETNRRTKLSLKRQVTHFL